MAESTRSADMRGEAIVHEYMNRYFYQVVQNFKLLPLVASYKDITDRDMQLRGIDEQAVLTSGRVLNIDEKCALNYINENLPTFAFETAWFRNGSQMNGWFLNDDLETNYYYLMWLRGKHKYDDYTGAELFKYDYAKQIDLEDISSVELYPIQKYKLRKYLHSIGLSKEQILEISNDMIQQNTKQYVFNRDIKFFHSVHLNEQPVNVVINKRILKENADSIYVITPDRIIRNNALMFDALGTM